MLEDWFRSGDFERFKKRINSLKQEKDKEEIAEYSRAISDIIRKLVESFISKNNLTKREFEAYLRLMLAVLERVDNPPKRDRQNDLEHIHDRVLRKKIENALTFKGGRYGHIRRVLKPESINSLYENKNQIRVLFSEFNSKTERNTNNFEDAYDSFLRNSDLKGIGAGTISMILSYLQPQYFCTYNNPVKSCLDGYLSKELRRYNHCKLEEYILINNKILHKLREECGIMSFGVLDNILRIISDEIKDEKKKKRKK